VSSGTLNLAQPTNRQLRYDTVRYMICTGKLTGKLPV